MEFFFKLFNGIWGYHEYKELWDTSVGKAFTLAFTLCDVITEILHNYTILKYLLKVGKV